MKKAFLTAIIFTALITTWSTSAQNQAEFNAGAGIISPPFVLTNGYIFQPVATEGTNGGRAVYSFTVAAQGQYAIRACVEAPAKGEDSLLVDIDSDPKDPGMVWEIPAQIGFSTNLVSTKEGGGPRYFRLTSGQHQVIIRGKSPNVKLVHIWVLSKPSPPTGLHLVTGP